MALSLVVIGVTFFVDDANPSFALVGLATYLAFFSFGMGPGAWLIPSEVFSTAIRAKAMSMATFLNRITATFITSTFLTAADVLSWGGFFFLLAFICVVICLLFLQFLVLFRPSPSVRQTSQTTNLSCLQLTAAPIQNLP